jgi:predicted esterase/catechol 2,3-dioxygenase-like lactoylglutathione lyase family enzyme
MEAAMNTTLSKPGIEGIHHITAIAGSALENHRFYTEVLGMRLVKKTVNFDDPGTYHLYFGDAAGTPGTILTFFPWEGMPRGRAGAGQVSAVAFSIAEESVHFWTDRLKAHDISFSTTDRFGETVLRFSDPDGLSLELVAAARLPEVTAWETRSVPQRHAVRGFHSATALLGSTGATEKLLLEVLGMHKIGVEGRRTRYQMTGETAAGVYYDIIEAPASEVGRMGAGSVHHIAFRALDESDQVGWRRAIASHGLSVTQVLDRNYFRSIYFREFGGVLFEIATDPPGFTVDETVDELGRRLMLPPWYENRRSEIENHLPPIPAANQMRHDYIPPANGGRHLSTLVALHGTGADERDLIPLAEEIGGAGRAVISPRGQVNENGLLRFFRRVAEGVFDDDDVRRRAAELADFLQQATGAYARSAHPLTAVGYSNGANIAAAILLLHPEVFKEAVLFRPMLPTTPEKTPDLSGTRVMILRGKKDRAIPGSGTDALIQTLRKAGADTTVVEMNAGHELTAEDVRTAKEWLKNAQPAKMAAAV